MHVNIIFMLEISTWYAEVAALTRKLGGNQSFLGISRGLSLWFPFSLPTLSARGLKLSLHLRLLMFFGEEQRWCREKL